MTGQELEWQREWESTLAECELAVEQAEAMLRVGHLLDAPQVAAWTPPRLAGPLPSSLERRARTLMSRQQAVAQQLVTAMHESRRHDRAVQRLRDAPPAPPVYVDLPA